MLAARTEAAALLPKPRSATGITVVLTGGVTLFVVFGSLVGEDTLAVLLNVPLVGAATVTVRLLTVPLVSVPNDQFTVPLLSMPLPLADMKVTPAGKVSVTTTLLADDGPKFVTEMV